MEWFAFGIDPLLIFLELNLSGILISSLPVLGPALEGDSFPLAPLEERFKAMAFCDDVKPAICSLEEFCIADRGAALFEKAAGTRLHRDPLTQKCKFLPLGKWRKQLKQEDIPTPYMKLTDTLDMVGVQLCDLWTTTRRKNGDTLKLKVNNLIGSWRAGKFMPLTLRPFSANIFALSRVWFRCSTINLRECDFTAINSSIKKWLYADLLLKPEELLLYRPVYHGGLGLSSIKLKSTAFLLRTFLELAANPKYLSSQYLNMFYRYYVLGEDFSCPSLPPYYNTSFFDIICQARNTGNDVLSMTTRQWYEYLLNKDILKVTREDGSESKRLCRVEEVYPDTDWESTWRNIRLPCLSSAISSFLWKLVNDLLTTEERVHSTVGNSPPSCRYCLPEITANQIHCFFKCCMTKDVGGWLLALARQFGTTDESKLLKLDVYNKDALVWVIAITLQFCWSKRAASKKAALEEFTAHLRAELELMKSTKFIQLSQEISVMLEQSEA